jgi:hypothetical protein
MVGEKKTSIKRQQDSLLNEIERKNINEITLMTLKKTT